MTFPVYPYPADTTHSPHSYLSRPVSLHCIINLFWFDTLDSHTSHFNTEKLVTQQFGLLYSKVTH